MSISGLHFTPQLNFSISHTLMSISGPHLTSPYSSFTFQTFPQNLPSVIRLHKPRPKQTDRITCPCRELHAWNTGVTKPFLKTAATIIDIQSNTDPHLNDLVMKFDVEKMTKKPTTDAQTFWIDTIDEVTSEMMHNVHSPEDNLEVILVQKKDHFGYHKIKTIGLARTLDSAESVARLAFSNIEKTQQKCPSFTVESGSSKKAQRSSDLPPGSIDPSCSRSIPETAMLLRMKRSNTNSIDPNVLKPIPSETSPQLCRVFPLRTNGSELKAPKYIVLRRKVSGDLSKINDAPPKDHFSREDSRLKLTTSGDCLERPHQNLIQTRKSSILLRILSTLRRHTSQANDF